jgi:hypothetical protein
VIAEKPAPHSMHRAKAVAINDRWRAHGESNPGFRRERAAS